MHVHTYRQLRILDRLSVCETSQLLNDNNYERRFDGLLYRVIALLLGCWLKLSLIPCSLTPPKSHLRMQNLPASSGRNSSMFQALKHLFRPNWHLQHSLIHIIDTFYKPNRLLTAITVSYPTKPCWPFSTSIIFSHTM
jgi:hypothetical protein